MDSMNEFEGIAAPTARRPTADPEDVCRCGDAFIDHEPECQIVGCGCRSFCRWTEGDPVPWHLAAAADQPGTRS